MRTIEERAWRVRSGDVLPAVLAGPAHVHGGRGLPLSAHGLLLRLRHGPPLGLLLPDHRHRLVFRHRKVGFNPCLHINTPGQNIHARFAYPRTRDMFGFRLARLGKVR